MLYAGGATEENAKKINDEVVGRQMSYREEHKEGRQFSGFTGN